jgi:hypothetical protein
MADEKQPTATEAESNETRATDSAEQTKPGIGHYLRRLVSGTLHGVFTYVGLIAAIFLLLWGIGRARSCGKQQATAGTGELVAGYELGERVSEPTYHYSYQPLAGSVAASKQDEGTLTYSTAEPPLTYVGFALRRGAGDVEGEAARVANMLSLEVDQLGEDDFVLVSREAGEDATLQCARCIVCDDAVFGVDVSYPADEPSLAQVARHVVSTLKPGSAE